MADDRKRVRVDFDTIFQDVTALGATAFTGKDKKQWEAKRLAALGAVVKPRKEKMPLKMAIGVAKVRPLGAGGGRCRAQTPPPRPVHPLQARKRRATAAAAMEKASGVITGKKRVASATSQHDQRGAREARARNTQQPDSLEPDNVRGSVMFVKRPGR